MARRSRACAYLADNDHGPFALQEILLASCLTVGVRTGASLVRHGVTGVQVDRMPRVRVCVANEADERGLEAYLAVLRSAQKVDRGRVSASANAEFSTERILDRVVASLDTVR